MNFKKQWGLWLGLLIVVGFSLLALTSNRGPIGVPLSVPGVVAGEHVKGNPDAKAILIGYGDFQCPACAAYEPLLNRLSEEFPNDLAMVFRHFPLRTIHPNANVAAYASEAADKQGKFWEMHDLLYAKQIDWEKAGDPKSMFAIYAVQLGLNKDQFVADMNSDAIKAKIDADYTMANRIGLTGTPTFFLNGKQLMQNPSSYEAFKALIEAEIQK